MSSCKALRMDCYGVKAALRHPLLEGKKMIGRGVFSMVFEGTRKNTVLKMTVDNLGYMMLNDRVSGIRHKHFPKVVETHDDIGETKIGAESHLVYLFEMERLEKLQKDSDAKRLARLITNVTGTTSMRHKGSWRDEYRSAELLKAMKTSDELPRSIKNALGRLEMFCRDIPGGTLDMHAGNFMQRKNGDLVMIDPIADMKLWEQAKVQVFVRGW